MMIWPLVFLAACLSLVAAQVNYLKPGKKLSYENLRILSSNDDLPHFNQTLQSICVPRVVGTPGHETVKDFIVSELKSNGMTVELDTFVAPAPIVGQVQFTNIIGRLNPDADRFLTLACHYDSKYFPNGELFLGAIDSAVPCAMMLNAIKTMSAKLAQRPAASNSDVSLMLIFFDGEEAFAEWTDTDSLYGSRHLAKRLPDIDRIDALVLLDLIGAASPRFLSYSRQTVPLFQRFVEIERELFDGTVGYQPMFIPRFSYASIADDHLPFVAEDVPIVHLITNPFPPQWHKIEDDLDHLDPSVIASFNKILRCFTYEYLVASRRSANFRIFG